MKQGKKLGYALGGGAARGMFHIGVLSVLEEYGITPDIIAGTSMGSIIGAMYASGLKTSDLKQIARSIDWKQIMRLTDIVALPKSGLIQGKRIAALLKSILGDTDFSRLKCKYAAVAADLYTGQQVVFTEGSLIEAIRASISIPGIFTPVHYEGHYLVDGGLVNVVPVSVCRDLGADFVIGVNVIPDPISEMMPVIISSAASADTHKDNGDSLKEDMQKHIIQGAHVKFHESHVKSIDNAIRRFLLYRQPRMQRLIARKPSAIFSIRPKLVNTGEPNVFEVLSRSLSIIEYHIAMENLINADIAITPMKQTVGYWAFHRAAEAIEAGEKTTRLLLERDVKARLQLTSF
ncbi:MAG: patatin-like phospholipase family protein [Dehalococcoidia bacterium]|nr:patatin-like phospholipase family protein [Dehalococcoidia bacterium]